MAALALTACTPDGDNRHFEKLAVERALQPFGLHVEVADTSVALLGWHAPDPECPYALKITSSYEPGLKFEENNENGIIFARHQHRKPYRRSRGDGTNGPQVRVSAGPIPEGVIVPGELFYKGFRAERVGASRDYQAAAEFYGPASPMAGCYWRTWDPMEDAIALGWPKVPARLTAVGESWNGLRVQAQCARAACVDPKTGGGGPDNHFRPCATKPFRETLAGVYEVAGERYAWITSEWDDGHNGEGISSKRSVLVSIEHGRPVWAKIAIDHRFAQPTVNGTMEPIVRTWEMTAIDECGGSLASVGWTRGKDVEAMLSMLTEGLQDSESLRKRRPKKEKRDGNEAE